MTTQDAAIFIQLIYMQNNKKKNSILNKLLIRTSRFKYIEKKHNILKDFTISGVYYSEGGDEFG